MKWQNKNDNPPIVKRIIVLSKNTNYIHIVHWDYNDWCLSETDEDFPGGSVEFDWWMPLPQPPEFFASEKSVINDDCKRIHDKLSSMNRDPNPLTYPQKLKD
jgi:hypothetical protein